MSWGGDEVQQVAIVTVLATTKQRGAPKVRETWSTRVVYSPAPTGGEIQILSTAVSMLANVRTFTGG